MNQFFDKVEVYKDYFLLFTEFDIMINVEFDCALNCLEKHPEVRISIGTANGRFVYIDFERGFFIQEVVNEVFNNFLSDHVFTSYLSFL